MEPLYGPPPATLVRLLDDPEEHDFPSPRRILDDLTGGQAATVPPGLPYSVAQIVAHMLSNMRFNLGLIQAADPLTYKSSSCGGCWVSGRSGDNLPLRMQLGPDRVDLTYTGYERAGRRNSPRGELE